MTHAPHTQAWLDAFFTSYYRHRPVNATFVGVHHYDERLPDYGDEGVAGVLSDMAMLDAQRRALPDEPRTDAEALDLRLAEGFLEVQQWEHASQHFQRGNPSVYAGEAAFGILSLLRRPFAPLRDRLDAAAARITAIPPLLAQGQRNVRAAPPTWTERAINECDGVLALLRDGLPQLLAEHEIEDPALLAAATRAAHATVDFQHYLRVELRAHPTDGYACGTEAFERYLRCGHFLSQSPQEIAAYAEEQIQECVAAMNAQAAEFGAANWRAALAQLADLHPSADYYMRRYTELWQACRATAERHNLVTWPDYPLRYVPRPRWVRSAAPYLYFLFYHAPAPFDRQEEVEYLVTPIEPDMPPDTQAQLLRATNDSVIKLNHVVHHGAIGHHVQNWYAARAASRVGQIAAVDCAARIAMFCGGSLAEGWACYSVDLMAEVGFLTPLERYAEHHSRLRMAGRALADVRLHTGAWSIADAARFYEEQIGMNSTAAHGEAVKNSMFPATALMYLMGTDQIHALRRDLSQQPGFELRQFHDRLLGFGSVPVALIAETMRREAPSPKQENVHAE